MDRILGRLILLPLAVLLMLAASNATTAGEEKPKRPPGKTASPVDYSDPKKTYATYLRAIKANDLEAGKKCWFFDDNDPAGALDVMVGLWVTAHRLSEVARSTLGARGWGALQEWNCGVCRSDCTDEAIDRTLERLKDAEVDFTGDKATLTIKWAEGEPLERPVFGFAGDHPVAPFRRVEEGWKLDAGAHTGVKRSAEFFEQGGWGEMFRTQVRATQRIISDLENGNLRGDEETIAAFEALVRGDDATSGKPRKLGPQLDQTGVPSSFHLGSGGLAQSSSQPPVLAVSDAGVIYVFWPAKAQKKGVPSSELPMIPADFSFGDNPSFEFRTVPGVNVCRDGVWSKPGVVVDGVKDCNAVFGWCVGERLHVLVADAVTHRTQHLMFDPQPRRWERVAELPFQLKDHDVFRQVGETIHIGFVELSGFPEHVYACYLSFDGRRWSKLLRIEQSDNRTRAMTYVRLAVDALGTAHLAWWSGTHGYAMIRGGRATFEPMQFSGTSIDRGEFDMGVDRDGRVIVAYKANLPDQHPESRKVHLRRRENGHWTDVEKIGGEREALFGSIRVVWTSERTLVTWISGEEYTEQGGVLSTGFRRLSIDDGKSWSPSRWMARYPTLRGNGVPLSAQDLGICVDKNGGVHVFEETRHYCLVARLNRGKTH